MRAVSPKSGRSVPIIRSGGLQHPGRANVHNSASLMRERQRCMTRHIGWETSSSLLELTLCFVQKNDATGIVAYQEPDLLWHTTNSSCNAARQSPVVLGDLVLQACTVTPGVSSQGGIVALNGGSGATPRSRWQVATCNRNAFAVIHAITFVMTVP